MFCSFNLLATATGCVLAFSLPFATNSDTWSEQVTVSGGNPALVKMATTYSSCYLSRGGGEGVFGRFRFGEKIDRVHGKRVYAVDGARQATIVQCTMDEKEYRHFRMVKLFFDKERQRLYKIVTEQAFPLESLARDRIAIVNGIIDDCKQGFGLSLARTVVSDNQVVYKGSDEIFEITLEICKQSGGNKRLLFSILNKKIQKHEDVLPDYGNVTNSIDCVEVQI